MLRILRDKFESGFLHIPGVGSHVNLESTRFVYVFQLGIVKAQVGGAKGKGEFPGIPRRQ